MSGPQKNHVVTTAPTLSLTFLAAFLLTIFFSALLIQIGSPLQTTSILMFLFLIVGYLFVGFYAKTMGFDAFQTAERKARPWTAAQAIASAIICGSIYILLAGQFYETGINALSQYSGWLLGIALLVIAFAAKTRRSGAVTVPGLALGDDRSHGLSAILIIVSIACTCLLVLFQLEFAGFIGERFLGLSRTTSILAIVIAVGFCVVFGGMQAVTIVRQVAYPVILLCFMAPIIWISLKISGIPIPQFTFGSYALQPIAEIDTELVAAGLETPEEVFDLVRNGAGLDGFAYLSSLVCIALGLAALPHIIQHSATVEKPSDARNANIGAFALVLLILSAIPAFAAFVRLDLYTSLLGLQLNDLETDANWFFGLSGAGNVPLISLCGSFVSTLQEAVQACGETEDYFISVSDIGINADFVAMASATLHELPELVTIMMAAGAMLALMTSIDGQFLSIGMTLSNDGYQRMMRPRAPKSVLLFVTRFFILLGIVSLTWFSLRFEPEPIFLFESAMALSAACLFPALFVRFWFPQMSIQAVLVSITSGFVVTSTLLVLVNLGPDLAQATGDELVLFIPLLTDRVTSFGAGFLGLVITCIGLVAFKAISTYQVAKREQINAQA